MQLGCLLTAMNAATEVANKHTRQHVKELIKVEIEQKKAEKDMKTLMREKATINSILEKKKIGSG